MKGPLETCDDKGAEQQNKSADFSEFMWMAEEGGVDAFDKKCEEEFMTENAEEFMDMYLQQMLEDEEADGSSLQEDDGEWWYPPQQQQQQQQPQQQPQQQQPPPISAPELSQAQTDSKSGLTDPAVVLASRMQTMQVSSVQQPAAPVVQTPVVSSSRLNPNAAVFVPRFLQVRADDR